MGTPLGPKYIPYTYMDPLGKGLRFRVLGFGVQGLGPMMWFLVHVGAT